MYRIEIIEAGNFYVDGGAIFGAVPKKIWSQKYPSNDENLCLLSMRCILATSKDRRILIDVGMGDKYPDRIKPYFPHNLLSIKDSLHKYGCGLSDITDVMLSHLHFDHCGYSTSFVDGRLVPTFPNAKYWISSKQWETQLNPNRLEADSIFSDDVLPLRESGQLNFVETDALLYKGLEVKLFDGHAAGQLVVYLKTDDGVVVFPGDLIPTASHLSLEWISAYDLCALTSMNEKERFLQEVAERGHKIVYCHDAYTVCSKVGQSGSSFFVEEATILSSFPRHIETEKYEEKYRKS